MSVTHDLRNWLHHLLLAAQVGHVGMLAQNFSQDDALTVLGPGPEHRWIGKDSWVTFLESYFETVPIGSLGLKVLQGPEVTHDEATDTAQLRWRLLVQGPGMSDGDLTLDCRADLLRENQRWVAHRLLLRSPED